MRRSLRRAFLLGVAVGVVVALARRSSKPPSPPSRPPALEPARPRPTWVAPVEARCPDGYPVKAKEASGIFHVPGGLSYERTRPDRCYPSAEAAGADGFRPAKR